MSVLSGVEGAEGGLRIEVTYLFASDGAEGGFAKAAEVMAADLLGEVYGVGDDGWNDEEAALALPSTVVHDLLRALFLRSLRTIECGFALCNAGDNTLGQLPLGHLPSIAERTLCSGALVLRMAGNVGSDLRAGLARFGFLGEGLIVCRSPLFLSSTSPWVGGVASARITAPARFSRKLLLEHSPLHRARNVRLSGSFPPSVKVLRRRGKI